MDKNVTYRTSEVAKIIGVHPNTIRFYEKVELLPKISRLANGYRVFNDSHIRQLRLLRTAFRVEIMSGRLRQEVFEAVKTSAAGDIEGAYRLTEAYLQHLSEEEDGAWEAIRITKEILEMEGRSSISRNCMAQETVPGEAEFSAGERIVSTHGDIHSKEAGSDTFTCHVFTGRKGVAEMLGISIDVLRDWERNGLLTVPRNEKGERAYGIREIERLKIIRLLRGANYSMMSILRMLNHLDRGEMKVLEAIDTPDREEDIVGAADRYITSLNLAKEAAREMLRQLKENLELENAEV